MIEDELLKIRFKQGSSNALARIYQKYADFLLTLAMALLNNTSSAEDILHDVFVKFAQSSGSFRIRGNLKSYLATCVVNRARDKIRTTKKNIQPMDETISITAKQSGPLENIICNERALIINTALDRLPYDQKEVVVLRLKAGMKFNDIAKTQGVSVNTVRGRYRYGIDKLRSILNGQV